MHGKQNIEVTNFEVNLTVLRDDDRDLSKDMQEIFCARLLSFVNVKRKFVSTIQKLMNYIIFSKSKICIE
jgi:hypothetical protein